MQLRVVAITQPSPNPIQPSFRTSNERILTDIHCRLFPAISIWHSFTSESHTKSGGKTRQRPLCLATPTWACRDVLVAGPTVAKPLILNEGRRIQNGTLV